MKIQELKVRLQTAQSPIERIIHQNEYFKVSILGFANGMMIREKRIEAPIKLLVLNGSIKYFELDKQVILNQYDEFEIPAEVTHYIVANDNSLCLMTQNIMEKISA